MLTPNRLMVSPALSHQSSGVSSYSAVSPYSQTYSVMSDTKRGSLASVLSVSTVCSESE